MNADGAGDRSPRERTFRLPAYELAALEWGQPGEIPVLALHGWLDNAGSFSALAPSLFGCHVVAIDAAGHGRSGNRSADAGYNIWQELGDIFDVAASLDWPRFNLLGHSRGASAATLFSGAFPARVERLMLIEGGLPMLGAADEAPQNLADSLERTRELRHRSGRIFASRRTAIDERMVGFSPVSREAAETLAARSLREVPGGWQWHADQRLKAGSELRLTRELLAPFLERIEVPAICVFAEDSPFAELELYQTMLRLIRGIELHHLPGRHHLHLEGAAPAIAGLLNRFIESH